MSSNFCDKIKESNLPPPPTFVKDEYLRYWKIIDEDATNKPNTGFFKDNNTYKDYIKYYIDDTKGYPSYIKDINLSGLKDYDINSIEANPWNFINEFLIQIFNNISIKEYLNMKNHKEGGILRGNHGGLNHFRSLLFSQYIVSLFLEKKLDEFKQNITNNKIEVLFLLLASYFQSLLRVNESSNPVPFFKQNTSDTNNSFINIFTNLNNPDILDYFTDKTSKMEPYMTTLASSFLFMSICKYLKKINKTIEIHLSDEFIDKIGIGLCMYEMDKKILTTTNVNLKSIFLIYSIVAFGHYVDHCRQPWSKILDEKHISFLLDTIGIKKNSTDKDYVNIIKYMILLLSYTEWNNTSIFLDKFKTDKDWETYIDSKPSNAICSYFSKDRYNNPNFIIFSKDYNVMYNGIFTNGKLNAFLNPKAILSNILKKIDNIQKGGSKKFTKSRLQKKSRKSRLPKKSRKSRKTRLQKN